MAQKDKKEKKHRKHPKLCLALEIIFLLMLVAAIGITLFLYFRYGDEIREARQDAVRLVEESTEDTFRATETSLAYDSKGKQIAVLKADKDVYYVPLSEIPQQAIDAMVVTEDKKFYRHKGIDIKAIGAAFVELVKNKGEKKRGASTITQQLARGIFLSTEKTWRRKIKEMFIALELEKKYDKNQIMEYYLNNIYFANGYYGIEAASKGYFNKSCKELNTAEITFLCSIPNSPTRYDPIANKSNTLERKNRILDQMLADGKITDVEYNEAYNYDIKLHVPKSKKRNYVETYVQYCATRAIMKSQGFEFQNTFSSDKSEEEYNELYSDKYSECQQMLFREGYRIYTSINTKKQKSLQKAIDDELAFNTEKADDGIYKFQGAGVCINNNTGRVIAVVGGRNQSVDGYTFNRAYQSYRQPGSAIKPVIIYTPYFERGHKPTDIVKDAPIKDGPKNSGGSYLGSITVRTAVERSVNTVAWNLFEELTPKVCMGYMYRMGFARLSQKDYNQASALGGLTNGVSPVEMASAYAAIENEGVYREPTCIIKITDSRGNVIFDDSMRTKEQVYDSNAAAMMTDVMEGVLTRGTAGGYALDNMSCAGKTGTTNDKKDGWFAGYTPYYTTVVWVGYDMPKSVNDLLGNTYPLRIWHNFMSEIHTGLENIEFPEYEGEENDKSYSSSYTTKKPEATDEPDDTWDNEPDTDDDNYIPEDDRNVPADDMVTAEPVITEQPVETAPPAPASEPSYDEPADNVPDDVTSDTGVQ